MKKLGKLWKENKILMILGAILLVCLIAILVVVLTYFLGSNKYKYGNRFDNMKVHIKEVPPLIARKVKLSQEEAKTLYTLLYKVLDGFKDE